MFLLHNGKVIEDYKIDLGFAPIGDKFYEGDGRTPEGSYLIDRKNPDSRYHLSIGISYPNANDVAYARAKGLSETTLILRHAFPNALIQVITVIGIRMLKILPISLADEVADPHASAAPGATESPCQAGSM